jgi:hypothetical protein
MVVPSVALIILYLYCHAMKGVGTYSMIALSGSLLIPTMYEPPFRMGGVDVVGTVFVTSTAWMVYGLPTTVASVVQPAAKRAACVSGNITAFAVWLTGAFDRMVAMCRIAAPRVIEDVPEALGCIHCSD